jgi:hypothetical protein
MMLLIDYLEDAAEYLRKKTEKLQKLDEQYRHSYDRDLKREMGLVRQEIRKKRAEITTELLVNLEEFRYLKKYFPELLQTFMEDEYIGNVLSRKAWLLDFEQLPPQQAAAKLEQLKIFRAQLKDAKKFLKKWVGKVGARAFVATYPALKGHLKKDMEKDEVLEIIDEADKQLRREGWLLLITDSLIQIPTSKFLDKIRKFKYEEMMAEAASNRAKGRGTIAEANALRKLKKVRRRLEHYENVLKQVLLTNPSYLREIKKKKQWLSREKGGTLEKFAEKVTPHKVKERSWLNDMKKRIEGR